MFRSLQNLNPLTFPNWNELLLSGEKYSFFHTSNWARVLSETYGYTPLYFTSIYRDKIGVIVPVMEIKNRLMGMKGVSLPFTDYCDPIINGNISFQKTFEVLTEYGREHGWKSIEIRGGKEFFTNKQYSSYFYGHSLHLSQNEKKNFSSFRSSTQRNIKKAMREGVRVDKYNSYQSINEFYKLNCITRKMHGLPPQPKRFFNKIFEHIISKNKGYVFLATYRGEIISGAVFFHFGTEALYKHGASRKEYQDKRANNLVMWEAIKWYSSQGYEKICFGKTDPEHKGLRQFKNGWGVREHIIRYYKYDIKNSLFIKEKSLVSGFHNKIFNKMPIPLLKIISIMFYKYIG